MQGGDRNISRSQVVGGNDKFMDEERKEDLVRKTQIKVQKAKAVKTNISDVKGAVMQRDLLDLD
jgi:hypothetical protein